MAMNRMRNMAVLRIWVAGISMLMLLAVMSITSGTAKAAEEQGSVGIEGRISAPAPTTAATITIPRSGQAFTTLPVTVSGICPNGLLVKLFKNNVFAGSVQCNNGSYSMIIDLFDGQNDLVARVYDALDQAGPDSNIVTVSYSTNKPIFSGQGKPNELDCQKRCQSR